MPDAIEVPRPSYAKALRSLVEDANATERQLELADGMAYALSLVIVEHGPGACSFVLDALGRHIGRLHDERKALAKAQAERAAGAATH